MSIATQSTAPPGREEVEYPASDGQPMAETGLHVQAILLLFQAFWMPCPIRTSSPPTCSGTGRSPGRPDVMVKV